jgi:hypothetical protein
LDGAAVYRCGKCIVLDSALAAEGTVLDWRAAQAFDLAGITNTVGAPSFAQFAKGGNHQRIRNAGRAERT